jgi:hypothetical protein
VVLAAMSAGVFIAATVAGRTPLCHKPIVEDRGRPILWHIMKGTRVKGLGSSFLPQAVKGIDREEAWCQSDG